jgi:peptide/nickel transport system permease protein
VRFVLRRLVRLVLVLFAVTFLSFVMLSLLPGDAASVKCGIGCTEEGYQQAREELRLDDPIIVRYADWMLGFLSGDLGKSQLSQEPIFEALRNKLPTTLELVLLSQVVALAVAIPLGILAARRAGSAADRGATIVAFGFVSMPNFVLALVLVSVFAVNLNWLPATDLPPFTEDPLENLRHAILPVIALAAAEIAVYMQVLRVDLISTMQEDYITMAKAKGMPGNRILFGHALRPSMFSLLTVIGLNLGRLVGGTLVIERLFAIPGVGSYIVDGIFKRDVFAVQGAVVVIAISYVLINFAVDMLYAVLDPRIRHARALA